MKENGELYFAVLPDLQLGRELFAINFYDPIWLYLCGIPFKEGVVGGEIDWRLKGAVEFINSRPEIEFVVSIGDLTDSGTPEQFQKVREILDKLQKPFIPMIGNHDLWPYRRKKGKKKVIWEAKRPLTVEEFEVNFPQWKDSPCFEYFEAQGGWLQNYAFSVSGIRFVVVDNNNRRKALFGLPGQAGWSKLYPMSEEWLERQCFSEEERIIILSHAPLAKNLLKEFQGWAKKKLLVNISGHTHKRTAWRWENVITLTTNALYHESLLPVAEVSREGFRIEYHPITGGDSL